ncbi:hypothetical protein RF11_14953 [Thelohanellus kitauei]|uniref:Uncharacterized protein n=1 Tax=Thelohanellus kitauei TaxID=669202 RepID=A0A0C2JN50_THEKT|nr:hypothetical protein RF11_14953 [Thelohanellus kitauei]
MNKYRSMLICFFSLFIILSYTKEVQNLKESTELNFNLKNTQFIFDGKFSFFFFSHSYYLSFFRTINESFDHSNFAKPKFDSVSSELFLEFMNSEDSRVQIKCKTQDNDNDIEIGPCHISIRVRLQESTYNYTIGYRLKFNKDTKYEFKGHFIDIRIKGSRMKYIRLRLEAISIHFKCFKRTCENTRNYIYQPIRHDSTTLLYPCENDGRSYYWTTNTCPILRTDVMLFLIRWKTLRAKACGLKEIPLEDNCAKKIPQADAAK